MSIWDTKLAGAEPIEREDLFETEAEKIAYRKGFEDGSQQGYEEGYEEGAKLDG